MDLGQPIAVQRISGRRSIFCSQWFSHHFTAAQRQIDQTQLDTSSVLLETSPQTASGAVRAVACKFSDCIVGKLSHGISVELNMARTAFHLKLGSPIDFPAHTR